MRFNMRATHLPKGYAKKIKLYLGLVPVFERPEVVKHINYVLRLFGFTDFFTVLAGHIDLYDSTSGKRVIL